MNYIEESSQTYDNPAGKTLPNPRASRKTKQTNKWKEDTLDYFLSNKENSRGPRRSRSQIQSNWDFFNGILTKEEISRSLNPLDLVEIDEGEYSGFENYNIIKSALNTLIGESLKRKNDLKALAINPFVINEKSREWQEKVKMYLNSLVESDQKPNEEEVKKKLEELELFKRQSLQSSHEKLANQLLSVFQKDKHINAKEKFSRGFLNYEINKEAIFYIYRSGNNVDFRNVDSRNFYVLGLVDNWIENAQAWIEETWMNPYKIIETYPDLTDSEIKSILNFSEGESNGLRASSILFDGRYSSSADNVFAATHHTLEEAAINSIPMLNGSDYMDDQGNILVTHVEWRGLRKLGKLKYLDPITGEEQVKWVDEDYPIDEEAGENVEYSYVNEIYSGVKIGDKIYHNIGPSDTQMRSKINPGHVTPNYVGYIDFNDGGLDKSRLETLKPYQRDYNVYANKLRKLWTEHIGKVAVVDMASMPSNMEPDEWYAWVKETNIMFMNSFEMGKEGLAKNLLAGNMQNRGNSIDLSLMNEISECIQMLDYNKRMVDEMSAVPKARQGDLTGKEGLGTSQQAIMSSSAQTEFDFFILDLTKVKTAEVWLEYRKVVGKEEKGTIQYLLDDLSQFIIEFDGEMLNESDYAVQITDSSASFEMSQRINQLIHPAMQNGSIGLVDAIQSIDGTPNEITERLKRGEDRKLQQQQESQDREAQHQQELVKMQEEYQAKAWEREKEKMMFQHKLDLEKIELENKKNIEAHINDTNQNNIEDEVEIEKEMINAESNEKLLDKKMTHEKEMQAKDLAAKIKIANAKSKT